MPYARNKKKTQGGLLMEFSRHCSAFGTASVITWCVAAAADAHADTDSTAARGDLRRLMQPSAAELAAERRGGVHIYDSLEINEVDAALDQNFDRIQNMMFTRIHHLPPTGSGPAEVEDDGCD